MCRIIFHFFRFYYSEMRRKLWPKASAKESAFGQMSNEFQVYFIHINFLKEPNKSLQSSQRVVLQCCNICFSIIYYLLAQKKWKLRNGPRLPTLLYILNLQTNYTVNFGKKNNLLKIKLPRKKQIKIKFTLIQIYFKKSVFYFHY